MGTGRQEKHDVLKAKYKDREEEREMKKKAIEGSHHGGSPGHQGRAAHLALTGPAWQDVDAEHGALSKKLSEVRSQGWWVQGWSTA